MLIQQRSRCVYVSKLGKVFSKIWPKIHIWPRVAFGVILVGAMAFVSFPMQALPTDTPKQTESLAATSSGGTSTDLFVMVGSDFDRPGLLPRANLNIGIGHTFGWLKKDPIGDELTFSYTYENSGSHAFFHTDFGEHTEAAGVMKNFPLPMPKTKVLTGYTWLQAGITSYTGKTVVANRFYSGVSLGGIVHLSNSSSIWLQESYNKVNTVPWYTTSSIGYTYSW